MTDHYHQCELLDDYLDGFLGMEQKANFRSHLDTCANCRTKIKSIRLAIGQCQEIWHAQQLSESVTVVRQKQAANRKGSHRPLILKPHRIAIVVGVASVLFAATFATWYWSGNDKMNPQYRVSEIESRQSPQPNFTDEEIYALVLREQPDSRFILTLGGDRYLRIWNANDGSLAMRPFDTPAQARQILVTADSRFANVGGGKLEIPVFEFNFSESHSGVELNQLLNVGELLSNKTISHDGTTLPLSTEEWYSKWLQQASARTDRDR